MAKVVTALDLKLPRFLSVTADDITKGKQGDDEWCPIARTIRRELKGYDMADLSVGVDECSAMVRLPITVGKRAATVVARVEFNLSKTAQRFIETFDEDRTAVKPIRLTAAPSVELELAQD